MAPEKQRNWFKGNRSKRKKYVSTHCNLKNCEECRKEKLAMRVKAYYERNKNKGLREVYQERNKASREKKKAEAGLPNRLYLPVEETAKPVLSGKPAGKKTRIKLYEVWLQIPGNAPIREGITPNLNDYRATGQEFLSQAIVRLQEEGWTPLALVGTTLSVTRKGEDAPLLQFTWNKALAEVV